MRLSLGLISRPFAAVALALASGCSDDGLTPNAGGTGAGDGGSGGSTASVSTTVTASADGGGLTGASPDDGPDDGADDFGTVGPSDTRGEDDTGRGDDGTADGGSSGGDAGASTGDDTGSLQPGTACVLDADCVVVNHCCACTAAHEDDDVVACPEACEAPQCDAAGIGDIEAECVFGHCVLQKLPCNGAFLACDLPAPACPDGMLPTVDEDATCWTGACVPAEVCDVVPDCSSCAEGEACVLTATQIAPLFSCWPVDASCEGEPTCGCMAGVCTNPFICGDGGPGDVDLGCSCPVCG